MHNVPTHVLRHKSVFPSTKSLCQSLFRITVSIVFSNHLCQSFLKPAYFSDMFNHFSITRVNHIFQPLCSIKCFSRVFQRLVSVTFFSITCFNHFVESLVFNHLCQSHVSNTCVNHVFESLCSITCFSHLFSMTSFRHFFNHLFQSLFSIC